MMALARLALFPTALAVIDPAIKHLNKDSAMPNRMPHFRESEKWPDQ